MRDVAKEFTTVAGTVVALESATLSVGAGPHDLAHRITIDDLQIDSFAEREIPDGFALPVFENMHGAHAATERRRDQLRETQDRSTRRGSIHGRKNSVSHMP